MVLGVPVELGDRLVEGLELGAELIEGESIVWLLGIELCSADGFEVPSTVVGTGLSLGSELGEGLIVAEGAELGASLFCMVCEPLCWWLGSELC